MAIRFRRVSRLCDPTNKEAGKKVYPVISYQYDTSATLDEFAKEIASASGVSEGETISVLKDFPYVIEKDIARWSFGKYRRSGIFLPFCPKQRDGEGGRFYDR